MKKTATKSRGKAKLQPVAIHTPDGRFIAWYSNTGLTRLIFPGQGALSARPPKDNTVPGEWVGRTKEAVRTALLGETPRTLPPLDLSTVGTDFQKRVWQALRSLRCGQTTTYGEMAAALGSPQATRAVGIACGANPIPLLIPCHRVVTSDTGLGGYSMGPAWKKKLLERERAACKPKPKMKPRRR